LPEIVSTSFDETMVVARPEHRSPGWPWVAALALVVAVGLGWFFLRGPKGTRLQIDSQPSGAKVYVNDLAVGTTPMNQPLVAGDKLRLELKGHAPVTYEIKSGEAPGAFPLQPVISHELIDSMPRGATVVMDEKPLEGVTPLTVRWNQGQPHRLTLTKETQGHASDFGLGEVPGGRVFELKEATTAETRQEPPLNPHEPGAIKLSGGFSVRVKVAGKDLGELSPGAKLPLPPGTHQLELSSARHFYKDTRAVSVTAGQTTTLTSPGLATLTVNTYPGSGKVFVDGVDTGTESDGSSPIRLATGRHTITVRGPKGAKTEVVDLTSDKLLSFQL
jgi:hypothetical protein